MPEKVVNTVDKTVTFKFEDGSEDVIDLSKIEPDMLTRLTLHGVSQKGGDSYANAAKTSDPVEFAKNSVAAVKKQLYSVANGGENSWRVAAISGGPKSNDFALALSRATGETLEAATAFVEGLDAANEKSWKAMPAVAAQLAKIRAERAIEKADKLAKAAEGETIKLG